MPSRPPIIDVSNFHTSRGGRWACGDFGCGFRCRFRYRPTYYGSSKSAEFMIFGKKDPVALLPRRKQLDPQVTVLARERDKGPAKKWSKGRPTAHLDNRYA